MAMNKEQAHEDTAGLKTVQHAVDENDTKPWTDLLVCSLIQDCLVEVFQGYQVLVSEKRELPKCETSLFPMRTLDSPRRQIGGSAGSWCSSEL